jgi:ribose transport system substrate-binding protein
MGRNRGGISLRAWSIALACGVVFLGSLAGASFASGQPRTAGGSAAGSLAAVDPAVAAATRAIAPYLKEPTSNGITTPLSKKPPTGKLITTVECNIPVCQLHIDMLRAATDALGWKLKSFITTGAPEDVLKQMNAALDLHPAGLVMNGFPNAVIGSAMKRAKSEGVAVVNQGVTDKPTFPLVQVLEPPASTTRTGTILGNYLIADSKGTAHAVVFYPPVFPDTVFTDTAVKKKLATCAGCSYMHVPVQLTDIGTTLPQNVVSVIQAHPDVNYVIFMDGGFATGVAAALKAAGLQSKVKIVGQNGQAPNLQNVINGSEYAWAGYPVGWMEWAAADALARYFVGDHQITNPLVRPTIIQRKANTKSPEPWNPPNYQSDFKKLWHLGG